MNNAVYEYEINETLKVSLYYDEWNYSVYDALGEGFGVYMINRRFSNHDAGDLANEIEAVTLGVDIARDAKVTIKSINGVRRNFKIVFLIIECQFIY
jgi:hypothetical protein